MHHRYITMWGIVILIIGLASASLTPTSSTQSQFVPTPVSQPAFAGFPFAPDAPQEQEPEEHTAAAKKPVQTTALEPTPEESATSPNEVIRLEGAYTTTPYTFDEVNEMARSSMVNIICTTPYTTFQPVSGSGVMLENGVILTNAHVGQYVLLQDASDIPLDCSVRSGSPARPVGTPRAVYI